ncbi:MAG: UvrD-helicase domain-containing protein [Candidatus Marinimicrobia bacterium]|nr:UvrD-helicase domain-containing protein [Candidatus Neomarinimicrobiota bacterium]MCF7839827.1 UvrD-helicase domain-containing protein [Candidatus Neomarinimicrobiota bacterium]MCF7902074.1 UvrD-helicase domain-containing protein [Candidatus Neomarinimicrobiota bacterium]
MSDLLAGLNPEQQAAVEAADGPVLIFAGAGSGKTRVLTHRIAYLIQEKQVPPQHILAVTFTNKAAGEMRDRILALVGERHGQINVGTFHAISARILRREAESLGYSRYFTIYDDDDGLRVVKQIFKDKNLPTDQVPPKGVFYSIKNYKNQMIGPDELADQPYFFRGGIDLVEVYKLYERRLKHSNAMDFDDLLLKPIELFQKNPAILKLYQNRFRYILVDEYQDTNRAQFQLVKILSEQHGNLCVVGDDDQSIYGWRGADIRNILDFREAFPKARIFKLERNYRSTKTIVSAASAVVGNNRDRASKQLWTEADQGDPITVLHASDDQHEARLIADKLLELSHQSDLAFSDMAILYRTNAQSRALEERLRDYGIPYQLVGGTKFYDRKEVKDTLAYLRIIQNPADDVSVARVLNTPPRGIGKTSELRLASFALEQDISLFDALQRVDETAVGSGPANRVKGFVELIQKHQSRLSNADLGDWVQGYINDTGLIQQYQAEDSEDAESRIENIYELINGIREFQGRSEQPTLAAFLEEVALLTDVDKLDEDRRQVTLMTCHSAKGLEFPIVFLAGLEDGLFPLIRQSEGEGDLEEERRLFYVGLTRAEQRAFISYCSARQRYGETMLAKPSRFISEIPTDLLEMTTDGVTEDQYSRTAGTNRRGKIMSERKQSPFVAKRIKSEEIVDYAVGQTVEHAYFGRGRILTMSGSGGDTKLTILFAGNQQKKIIARYAKLKIITK